MGVAGRWWCLGLALAAAGCSVDRGGLAPPDATGPLDAGADGSFDATMDAPGDAGPPDAGPGDAAQDAPPADAPVDAPPPDACPGTAETCNERDDDCDGVVDEDFDVDTDIANCGSCGNACEVPDNAMAECTAGTCGFVCLDGFEDCDGDPSNGCEANLGAPETCGDCSTTCVAPTPACEGNPSDGWSCTDTCSGDTTLCDGSCVDTDTNASHCGSCGNACDSVPNATATCAGGSCGFECNTGYGDCDSDATNGCEQSLLVPDHCGSCGNDCPVRDHATRGCTASGSCTFSCTGSWADCNGMPADGCESDLADPDTCGDCTTVCPGGDHATRTCSEGSCGISCDSGWADCDLDPETGCEADLSSTDTCGSCGTSCSGSEVCTSGGCEEPPSVSAVDPVVIAHGAQLTVMGSGFSGTTAVSIGGTDHGTFTVVDDGTLTVTVRDVTPVGDQDLVLTDPAGSSAPFVVTVIHLVVNEVDKETGGIGGDDDQFVEVATGVADVALDGYTVVFFDGSDDQSHHSYELSASADGSGLLLTGNPSVSPAITFPEEELDNGPAAVAIYQALPGDFPDGTAVTADGLIDAVVYSRYDVADDTGLLGVLLLGPGQVQVEGEGRDDAFSRCGPSRRDGREWELADETPGSANSCP